VGSGATCHRDRSSRWCLARVGRQRPRLLYLDLREQVGADREQDRAEAAEDREVGRDAERETAVERAAQAVDAVAQWVEPHRELRRARQVRYRKQRARKVT